MNNPLLVCVWPLDALDALDGPLMASAMGSMDAWLVTTEERGSWMERGVEVLWGAQAGCLCNYNVLFDICVCERVSTRTS